MKSRKQQILRAINVAYLTIALLFILDCFQILEVKTEFLKLFIFFGTILSTLVVLIANIVIRTSKKWIISVSVMAVLVCTTVGIISSHGGPMKLIFLLSEWNTQTVLYEHSSQPNRTIEHQMRDVGALGYRNRTVEVFYITPWFMITKEIDEEPSPDRKYWVKSGKYVNELELHVE